MLMRWETERRRVEAAVHAYGFNREMGAFVRTLGGTDLDAALLTMPFTEFIDANHPRFVSTVRAIREGLEDHGLLYRYLSPDGLPPGEGAFLACSFWLAEVLCRQGRLDEAHTVFERALGCANHAGLLSEEADPRTGEPLGNFPQGLSHVGVINAALAIEKAEKRRPSDVLFSALQIGR